MKILILGNRGGSHLGGSFLRAARDLELDPIFLNAQEAYQGPKLIQSLWWHLLDKRPLRLASFSKKVRDVVGREKPQILLATGLAPLRKRELIQMAGQGTTLVNFLTDDPWSPNHYRRWFFPSLAEYDHVFSPRQANLEDLKDAGVNCVHYLPFGYDPSLFYKEEITREIRQKYSSQILFAGGADKSRLQYVETLIKGGFDINLYGGYWDRYPSTRHLAQGLADIPDLRKAIGSAKIVFSPVRRANRDDNCMRTFETPAAGGCMLLEDTETHRKLFGEEGEMVLYFSSPSEINDKARWLLSHEKERREMKNRAHTAITEGNHTYKDRLESILETVSQS